MNPDGITVKKTLFHLDDSPSVPCLLSLMKIRAENGIESHLLTDIQQRAALSIQQTLWVIAELQKSIAHISQAEIDVCNIELEKETRLALKQPFPTPFIEQREQQRRKGFVYIIKADKYFKIGYTKTPEKRITALDVKSPFPMHVVLLIPCEDMIETEEELHETFASQRIRGEWFALTEDDLQTISEFFPTVDPSICRVS